MMKLLLIASAASAWSLGVPKGLPKLNNRALQSTQQRPLEVATAPSSSTALKATEVTGGAKSEDVADKLPEDWSLPPDFLLTREVQYDFLYFF